MHPVVTTLQSYLPLVHDPDERGHVLRTIDFINQTSTAFERHHEPTGHVGASAVVFDKVTHKVLLTRHSVTHQWSFFGAHCDGNTDLAQIAATRILQDAGDKIAGSCNTNAQIFDVDIHDVPTYTRHNNLVPSHPHYDIAFLFHADLQHLPVSENTHLFSLLECHDMIDADQQFYRILGKLDRRS